MIDLSLPELLAGLAEECGELTQASLKLRRVFDGTNPTPVTENEAIDRFEEEIADVMLYLNQIAYSHMHVKQIMEEKYKRWENRMNTKGD